MNNINTLGTSENTDISHNILNNKELNNLRLYPKILQVFNTKSGKLIVFAEGLAVGGAFKDLISSLILHIIMPLLFYTFNFFKISYITNFLKTKNNDFNVYLFMNNLIIFVLLCFIIYYINVFLNIY